jgi:hypothetical protein
MSGIEFGIEQLTYKSSGVGKEHIQRPGELKRAIFPKISVLWGQQSNHRGPKGKFSCSQVPIKTGQ